MSGNVEALERGSAACRATREILDGDGRVVSTAKTYNQRENKTSNYRCGYVAVVNGKPVYFSMWYGGTAGAGDKGSAEYTVPEGASELYLVIQAAPGQYDQCRGTRILQVPEIHTGQDFYQDS